MDYEKLKIMEFRHQNVNWLFWGKIVGKINYQSLECRAKEGLKVADIQKKGLTDREFADDPPLWFYSNQNSKYLESATYCTASRNLTAAI